MKITKIVQQQKKHDRYSVFVDGTYSFSLSELALLDSKIVTGQVLTAEQVTAFKQLSQDDKLYNRVLNYVALRPRSVWEVEFYLRRKEADPPLITEIIEKLQRLGLLDDYTFAAAFVHDRRLLRSSSKRKLQLELRKKRVPTEVIDQVLAEDETDEGDMLQQIVAKKQQQAKYRDDPLKLMQHLARQGFSYGDIKDALSDSRE